VLCWRLCDSQPQRIGTEIKAEIGSDRGLLGVITRGVETSNQNLLRRRQLSLIWRYIIHGRCRFKYSRRLDLGSRSERHVDIRARAHQTKESYCKGFIIFFILLISIQNSVLRTLCPEVQRLVSLVTYIRLRVFKIALLYSHPPYSYCCCFHFG
jgi:hypothetical protein